MDNLKTFQDIIVGGKVSKTKSIIIALLKAGSNVPNIETPDKYTNIPLDVFDTSRGIKNHHTNTIKKLKEILQNE